MSTYPDGIGYLRNLGHSEGIPWLEMICDVAASGTITLSPSDLDTLVQLFTKRASYLRQPAPPRVATPARAAATITDRLETIGPFHGFKRLGDSLTASFPRRVSIVFGANGSGKSSLCDALQILASHDAPKRPLHDVRATTASSPSFDFKFTSDATIQNWSSSDGYGSRASALKYFDSGVAVHNIKNSVQPSRIIELAPFKLDVFGTAKKHCEELRSELQRIQNENAALLKGAEDQVRTKFATFAGTALATLSSQNTSTLKAQIESGETYTKDGELEEKLRTKAELEKATSEEGLKLLKGEISALKALNGEIHPILIASEVLIEIDPVVQARTLKEKEEELEVLARALIPKGANLEKLMALIRPANEVCNLHSPEPEVCPLCKQALEVNELELFKQYADLLTGELDAAITQLRKVIETADKNLKAIADSVPDNWAKDSVLPPERIEPIKSIGRIIKERFKKGDLIDHAAEAAAASFRALVDEVSKNIEEKEELIENARKDRDELLRQLSEITTDCQALLYRKEIAENINLIEEAYHRSQNADYWDSNLPIFATVLRKITSTVKKAHKELVVEDFKARLNDEYLALAEREMSAFGVELKDVGGDGAVTVDHHVAGQKIEAVLSEGEQRIHALALFFAELETCGQQVIVFDDPISSFDYNYIGNYSNRLRDFIQKYPARQVVVLTHNWEFFVQMQTTMNRAGLNGHTAVYVLESCVALDEYSESIDDLKSGIDTILSISGEPSKEQKESMGGKMRRLIEAVVNTHVFNKQRHQFKQKNQQVSAFSEFTKVVPLLPSEAQSLRDLFEKLSITEHDDPRNAYVNTDKAMFVTRYTAIKDIETAIIGRK